MASISTITDKNTTGGAILKGAPTVLVNGLPVGIHPSQITPHSPWGEAHNSAVTTSGSPTVFAEGFPVLKIGSGNSCGHTIVSGSPNVEVP